MKTTRSSFGGFWVATVSAALGLALGFSLGGRGERRAAAALPPFPVPGRDYIGYYSAGDDARSADFYLFHYGILGFRKRMARADLLLLGSSHVVFGLSAGELGERPGAAFNASILSGTIAGGADLLRSNGLEGKRVVVDLFEPGRAADDVLPLSRAAVGLTAFEAYWRVGKIWANFYRDYAMDPLFPRIVFEASGPLFRPHFRRDRFLQLSLCRDARTGDAEYFWGAQGFFYPVPFGGELAAAAPPEPGAEMKVDAREAEFARARASVLYTLVPFDCPGYEQGRRPEEARPFVPIAAEGLLYFDETHLSGAGRKLATERLRIGMKTLPEESGR